MKTLKALGIILLVAITVGSCTVIGTVGGWFDTWFGNKTEYVDRKIDDATNYETIKQVEDTCRRMIASYESDKLTYEQYAGSDNDEKQSWAEQAKMRANKTASSYNNYILKNSFVWKGNVPDDIKQQLEVIQ